MSTFLKSIIKKGFNRIGLQLSNLEAFNRALQIEKFKETKLIELKKEVDRLTYINSKSTFASKGQLELLGLNIINENRIVNSKSQLSQDLFVLQCLNFKKGGFFVEFGATDGKSLSNSYLLEKEYAWKGILAEPAKTWHQKLKENRSCIIETKCIWNKSGTILPFIETNQAELSTITYYSDSDFQYKKRKNKIAYEVETLSLNDLLLIHGAPTEIDYLSVDTEGSESEILQAFDFSKYKINVLTVEHNYTPQRQKIFDLLTSSGFRRVFETITLFDDWYINDSIKLERTN
jgi:FkbM family methyltransferase